MKLKRSDVTGTRAEELYKWCTESVEWLRELAEDDPDLTPLEWWNDYVIPEEITSEPKPFENMEAYMHLLEEESYEWASIAYERHNEKLAFEVTIEVERFEPANDTDGPFSCDDNFRPLAAVALRFESNEEVKEFLNSTCKSARFARRGSGSMSKMPFAGRWSKDSRCWWVLSTYWEQIRKALLVKGVKLVGSLAHPKHKNWRLFPAPQRRAEMGSEAVRVDLILFAVPGLASLNSSLYNCSLRTYLIFDNLNLNICSKHDARSPEQLYDNY